MERPMGLFTHRPNRINAQKQEKRNYSARFRQLQVQRTAVSWKARKRHYVDTLLLFATPHDTGAVF